MSAGRGAAGRGLMVLADGAQAAFAAGSVAELARAGVTWDHGAGAGLGAQIALLAVLGEAVEAERRWLREAELGCPLLRSQLAAARELAGPIPGVVLAPDPWTLTGWLDPVVLGEHIAPEMAGIPERLTRAGRRVVVAVEDVRTGEAAWAELAGLPAAFAGAMLRASATFPAGWGPEVVTNGGTNRRLWGGVGAAFSCPPPWVGENGPWDLVCGFPVPVVVRPALGDSLLELMQRRQEAQAGATVSGWLAHGGTALRLIAPETETYRTFAVRDDADLGVEYPLPWERNGELTGGIVRLGAFVVSRVLGAPGA